MEEDQLERSVRRQKRWKEDITEWTGLKINKAAWITEDIMFCLLEDDNTW